MSELPLYSLDSDCLIIPTLTMPSSHFYLTQCITGMVSESQLPQKRQLIVFYYQLNQPVDDFAGGLTVSTPFDEYIV
jgi:hypothetical protein